MNTICKTSDTRVKPVPFSGFGLVKPIRPQPPKEVLSLDQIIACLNAKMPPISKAAALLYPNLEQLSATAKLHGKIRNYKGRRKLSPKEQEELSDIILKLRSF